MKFGLIFQLLPLVALTMLVLGLCSYVALRVDKGYHLRYALVPAALAFGWFSYLVYAPMLGRAVSESFPDNAMLLGSNVVVKDGKKTAIELWLKQGTTRLYVVPYSKSMEEQLEMARKFGATGATIKLKKFKEGDENGRRLGRPGEESPPLYVVPEYPDTQVPKDAPEEE